jgi:hypothetical protein
LIAADYSLDVLTLGYKFKEFIELFGETDYKDYAVCLFLFAPLLTLSNVLALFQSVIDKLRYVLFSGTKYILSELNAESIALAESIRKENPYVQIVFAGVGNPEKKYDTKLLDKARELSALCLKRDISHLYFGFPLQKYLIFLISHHEPENVADALALIKKYKDTRTKIDLIHSAVIGICFVGVLLCRDGEELALYGRILACGCRVSANFADIFIVNTVCRLE